MKSLIDYLNESQITQVPEAYKNTCLGLFWNSIRTVSEKRTSGWTHFEDIVTPIKQYVSKNKNVPILTKFGTGKKLPCSDMVRFISCMLANIEIQQGNDESYIQKEINQILKDIEIKGLTITVGHIGEMIDSYLDDIRGGVKFYRNETTKPFDGISIEWSTGHIDIKI